MAITFIQKRKKQKYLILTFVILILVISFIVWFKFFKVEEAFPVVEEIPLGFIPRIKINFEVLENPILQEFQSFPEAPSLPAPEQIGRENPFLPYK